ncbi:MAG: flagellar assembly protein FliW [Synergistales bacterium]
MSKAIRHQLTGSADIEECALLTFPQGLPGFEAYHRWALAGDEESVIRWLLCADDAHVALPVTDPLLVDPGYSPHLPTEALNEVGAGSREEVVLLAVLVLPRGGCPWRGTANLLAPLVIQPETRLGRQVVLAEDRYRILTPLLSEEEIARIEGGRP